MSDRALPVGLRRRSDTEAIADDLLPYRGTTIAQRSEIMNALCRWAAEQIAAHPKGERILAFQERRSPRSLKLWQDLVDRARVP